ncbi:hypothetical protein [Streptomyces sp. NPDC093094]|uniref:hypothetical protein n=1 Tax=Streptomyces sp. NPDC093094 TaxID=3366026 RepID=UPI0037F81BD1
MRPRIRLTDRPRRALVLTDTPHPTCPECRGEGGTAHDYGDHTGEYAGTEWAPCHCWDEARCLVLLPLPRRPRWLRRHDHYRDSWGPVDYSDEPPF